MLRRCFFLLSGEHLELPQAELQAILESELVPLNQTIGLTQVSLVDTTLDGLWHVAKRAAMVHSGGIHLLTARIDRSDWKKHLKLLLDNCDIPLQEGSSFAVRARRIQRSCPFIEIPDLERLIGACLLQKRDLRLHVDLEDPYHTFYAIVTDGYLVLGLRLFSIQRSTFDARRAQFRRFVHPSAINPRFARMMVNLARVSSQKTFLDPFTGSGGMLLEAGLIGCPSFGIDLDPTMIHGAQANLNHFKIPNCELIVGDARSPPFKVIDAIATDPPYGASSSTKGETVSDLVSDALMAASDILAPGGYICIATPHTISLDQLGINVGLQLTSLFRQFVHRSLTRLIGVFKR